MEKNNIVEELKKGKKKLEKSGENKQTGTT
jgi:hypothetical protein